MSHIEQDERLGRGVRVAPMEWLRGPARLEDGWIELDRERARPYTPLQESDLTYDLAAIRRPPDALAFVQRYGLLRHGPDSTIFRERFTDFEDEANALSDTLFLYELIQRAVRGDAAESNDAIRHLWDVAPKLAKLFDNKASSDDELIDQATQVVTDSANQGLDGVVWMVSPSAHNIDLQGNRGQVGGFSLGAYSPTLLGAAYHQLSMEIVDRVLMRGCPECGRYFVVKDKRQRFCSPTCGSRARQRRFADRQKEKS